MEGMPSPGAVLRPYQEEAVDAILEAWQATRSILLVLPTGCGKTVVFSEIARRRLPAGRILVIAHRGELLEQDAAKLKAATGVDPSLDKASSHADPSARMVIASVQTLFRKGRLAALHPETFVTAIIDEAHHAAAISYRKIVSALPNALILGATATPERRDGKALGSVFGRIAYEYPLLRAVREGWLVNPVVQTVPLKIDLSGAPVSCGDYVPDGAAAALEPCLGAIAREIAARCCQRETVIFTPLVKISLLLQSELNGLGFSCAEVNAKSPYRREILEGFQAGKFKAVCNSMLLTEGWDCPSVDCIVVLRPTRSRGLYAQMIGRGMRQSPATGKKDLLILDFLWLSGRLPICRPATLIASSDSEECAITKELEAGGGQEAALLGVQDDQKLAAFSKMILPNRFMDERTFGNLLEIYSMLADFGLCGYEPKPCDPMPPTEKQAAILKKAGLCDDGYPEFSKDFASKFITLLIERAGRGLCTFKQFRILWKRGFLGAQEWTFGEAGAAISAISRNGWTVPPGMKAELARHGADPIR